MRMKHAAAVVLFLMGWAAWAQDWVTIKLGDAADRGLVAGRDIDGSTSYIIRSPFQGGVTIGKYIPKARSAYVSWGGKENRVTTVELYVGGGEWQPMRAGEPVPEGAVVGGNEADGSPLYIIRATRENALVPGKYSRGTGKGYIPFGGKEIELASWEILVKPPVVVADETGPLADLVQMVRGRDPRLTVFPMRVDDGLGSLMGQLTTQAFQWNGRAVDAYRLELKKGGLTKITLTETGPSRAQDFELAVISPFGRLTGAASTRSDAIELNLQVPSSGTYTMLIIQRSPGALASWYNVTVQTQGWEN